MSKVDLIKRPAPEGDVPRRAVREFIRAMGLDPRDVRAFAANVDRVRVEVYHRNADGQKWATPDYAIVTYFVTRRIS